MGFDNECIVNIQSLAGEYFCPVCRLLVYPNEALQAQCTHLYCKPCLTYTVSTTRACPYDGYLVTEADSKPLTESNKTLAETIGKIAVHCLYHRSGCTWQGCLSECISHCSGCAFGNSPVVCNRCGIQIVHRQVQEHAQNCPGVQTQMQPAEATQDPSASSAAASTGQGQTGTQVGATASQAANSQALAATTTPGQDSNQLSIPTSQTQPLPQTVVQPTAEQWYQQQQYQQYYQQYPGYDPYQQQYQHYYPYQQAVVPQYQQHVQAYGHPQPQSQPQPQAQTQAQLQPQAQPQVQGQSQSIPHVQPPVVPQSQSQMQVNQPQQIQPAIQPYSQNQLQSQPPAHGQAVPQSQPYLYPQAQPHPIQPQAQQPIQLPHYQQPHPQVQTVQNYPVSQAQVHPQLLTHASGQHLSQHQMHALHPNQPQIHSQQPNQPLTPNLQPQLQSTSAHAVTGHHSYPQPQPPQNMLMGAPQHPINMHPQAGPQLQSQQPVHMQNQFPQQPSMMRPHQPHAMFPNQQQPALLPSPVQGQSIPHSQQQPLYAHAQHHGQINQGPVMLPVQQPLTQQPLVQQQMPMSSHLRPQGPSHPLPEHTHTYPQPQANVALSQKSQHNQSQKAVGRPFMPNHAVQLQPLAHASSSIPVRPTNPGISHLPGSQNMMVGTNNQLHWSSDLQARALEPIERQGDVAEQKADSPSAKCGSGVKDLKKMSVSATDMKSVNSETDLRQIEVGNKQRGEDPQSLQTSGTNVNALENGDSVKKNFVMDEATENSGAVVSGVLNDTVNAVKDKEIQDRPLLKNSSSLETAISESQSGKLQKDDARTPQPLISADNAMPIVSTPALEQSGNLSQLSRTTPYADHGRHQQPMVNYGPASVQQRTSAASASQLPLPAVPNQPLSAGPPSSQVRNYGPAPALHPGQSLNPTVSMASYGVEHTHHGTQGQTVQPQSLGTPGPFNQGFAPPFHTGVSNLSHIESAGGGALPPADMPGGMIANLPPHPPEGLGGQQRPTNIGAETYPHQRPGYFNGPEGFGLQERRFKPFPVTGKNNIDRRDTEDDLKKLPRPSLDAEPISKVGVYSLGSHDRGPHEFNYDRGPHAVSRLFPPPHFPNEAGERRIGFHEDPLVKLDSAGRPDYHGLGPGYGRHQVDVSTPRSPVGEYAEIPSQRFGALPGGLVSKTGIDDFDGRDPRHFGDSVGTSFRDSRFPHLPSHMHRGEFEAPGSLRMGEHRGDFIGSDGFAGHFRRGEHLGPHYLPRHLQLGERLGFGTHASHMRAAELGGPRSFESFIRGNRPHPRLGEPGFRSSFSLQDFPNDGGFLPGETVSFDKLRKRKAGSMGWCRICKVDCETVEGLDLHSQTREHQKMAMDMVKNIKQNAKKQKFEQSLVEDGSKSQNTSFEGHGNKH